MKKQKTKCPKTTGRAQKNTSSIESVSIVESREDNISQTSIDTEKPINYLLLETKEGRQFNVKVSVAKMFYTLKSMMEDSICDEKSPIKLSLISGEAMERMLKFAELHVNDPPIPEEIASKERRKSADVKDIDKQFVDTLSQSLLFELIIASNFLDFRLLLDVLCKSVANMIKHKNVDEIRNTFNIVNDFNPQEEEQLRQENAWIEKYPSNQ